MAWTTPKTYASGDVLTAADLNTYQRDNLDALAPNGASSTSFTPILDGSTTNPTLGTGSTATGYYFRVGNMVMMFVYIEFGTSGTNAGSGQYRIDISNVATADQWHGSFATDDLVIGSGYLLDSSSSTRYNVSVAASTTTGAVMYPDGTGGLVTDSAPFSWSTSDLLKLSLFYFA